MGICTNQRHGSNVMVEKAINYLSYTLPVPQQPANSGCFKNSLEESGKRQTRVQSESVLHYRV